MYFRIPLCIFLFYIKNKIILNKESEKRNILLMRLCVQEVFKNKQQITGKQKFMLYKMR